MIDYDPFGALEYIPDRDIFFKCWECNKITNEEEQGHSYKWLGSAPDQYVCPECTVENKQ